MNIIFLSNIFHHYFLFFRFIMSHQRSSSESSPEVELNPEETKAELLKRVKKKFSLKKSSKKAKPQVVKNPKNQHAVKSTLSVELKWSDFDGSVYKNVQRGH